jgi:hypothetical protein
VLERRDPVAASVERFTHEGRDVTSVRRVDPDDVGRVNGRGHLVDLRGEARMLVLALARTTRHGGRRLQVRVVGEADPVDGDVLGGLGVQHGVDAAVLTR